MSNPIIQAHLPVTIGSFSFRKQRMNTKHIVSVKNSAITGGKAQIVDFWGTIDIATDHTNTIRVTIDGNWMTPSDLNDAAKLFKKLAKVLATRE
jgi:hypothetical protein